MLQLVVVDPTSGNELTLVFVDENGESTQIPIMLTGLYTRQRFDDLRKAYEPINRYWGSLDIKTQEEIFDCYANIDDLCLSTSLVDGVGVRSGGKQVTSSKRRRDLHGYINKLCELHDYEILVSFFMKVVGEPAPPSDIESVIPERYRNQPPAKTYVRSEYIALTHFINYYRFLVPVIAMLANNLKCTTLAKDDKELYILKELYSYPVFSLPQAERLEAYVESHFHGRSHEFNRALNIHGLSEEDIPDLVKARVFVKALCTAEPYGSSHAVTTISKEVQRKLDDLANGFNNEQLRNKPMSTETGDDKSNITALEGYRIKTSVSNLTKGTLNHYSQQVEQLLRRWVKTEDIPMAIERVQETLEHFRLRVPSHLVNPVWETIAAGVLDKAGISTQVNDHTYFEAYCTQKAVAVTVFSYLGLSELGVMMSTDIEPRPPSQTLLAFNVQAGQALEKEIVAELVKHYPYYDPEPGGKTRSNLNNYALMAVDDTIKRHNAYIHTVNGPHWLLKECELTKGDVYELPSDAKQLLAEFMLIYLNRKPLVTKEDLFYQEFPELKPQL